MAALWELIIIILLFVANGIFAMSEIAVVSASKPRLRRLADQGSAGASKALDLTDEPTHFLSTVQIGITLIGILAGVYGGATLAGRISAVAEQMPLLAPYASTIGYATVVVLTTYISLIIGELVPKRLAMNSPEKISAYIARPMYWLSLLASPLVSFLTASTETVVRLMGMRPNEAPPVTEAELVSMVREGAGTGELELTESEMVERALFLDDIWLGEMMTPYPEIEWISTDDTLGTLRDILADHNHSRYPVIDRSADEVVGVVRARDILEDLLENGQEFDLTSCLHEPNFLPLSTNPMNALTFFRHHQVHMALLVDEFGSVKGLVTPMDVLEALVGDLNSYANNDNPIVQERMDGSFLVDGIVSIHELRRILNLPLAEVEPHPYRTLGGLVMAEIGSVPRIGDRFEWQGYQFEVVDMDGRRVDRVLVSPQDDTLARTTGPEDAETNAVPGQEQQDADDSPGRGEK